MSNQKSFGFSLDLKELIRILMKDPSCLDEITQALEEGPAESITTILGSSNLGDMEDPQWYSVFASTVKDAEENSPGFISRPKSEKSKNRIILNLREQKSDHVAVEPTYVETTAAEKFSAPQQEQASKPLLSSPKPVGTWKSRMARLKQSGVPGVKKEPQQMQKIPEAAQRALNS